MGIEEKIAKAKVTNWLTNGFSKKEIESIKKSAKKKAANKIIFGENNMYSNDNKLREICEIANIKDIGDLSDGYHTFNQLYHQRAVLFATIVNQNKDKSWKSFKHSDGKYCFDSDGEWFIVGIDTPEGSYTYHYEKSYWDIFKCQELECGKEWDGHTEEDVTRLLSLK